MNFLSSFRTALSRFYARRSGIRAAESGFSTVLSSNKPVLCRETNTPGSDNHTWTLAPMSFGKDHPCAGARTPRITLLLQPPRSAAWVAQTALSAVSPTASRRAQYLPTNILFRSDVRGLATRD